MMDFIFLRSYLGYDIKLGQIKKLILSNYYCYNFFPGHGSVKEFINFSASLWLLYNFYKDLNQE